ncbi:MAG: hypothetical protein M1818_002288 [Claussenomyces sp. TS43310]|nr:MAG: hypothetical protein M1818_002288 [Claussenomyces sp. TS43310]
MPSNAAAWLPAAKVNPLEVKSAPYTSPGEDEIVVKTGAVAINPVDWGLQAKGDALFPPDPAIALLVTRSGTIPTRPQTAPSRLTRSFSPTWHRPIPRTLTYESAAVFPLALSTAAGGLFDKNYLALRHPSVPARPTEKALLVWGGATSVGSNAIQLAVAAGYEVITTASPKNFAYVKKLGANQAFDYASPTVVNDLIDALQGKSLAGVFDAITINGAFEACADVLLGTHGGGGFIAACRFPPKTLPDGITARFILGGSLSENEVSHVIYEDFLPVALAEGVYLAAPEAQVVGKGLEAIQTGLDVLKQGVSARKIVVSL